MALAPGAWPGPCACHVLGHRPGAGATSSGRRGSWAHARLLGEAAWLLPSLVSPGADSACVCLPPHLWAGALGRQWGLERRAAPLPVKLVSWQLQGLWPCSPCQHLWEGHPSAGPWRPRGPHEPQLGTLGDSETQSLYPERGTRKTLASPGTAEEPGNLSRPLAQRLWGRTAPRQLWWGRGVTGSKGPSHPELDPSSTWPRGTCSVNRVLRNPALGLWRPP